MNMSGALKQEELRIRTVAQLARYWDKDFKEVEQILDKMTKQLQSPDEIQLEFEKRTDKEVFLDKFKNLHFSCNYSIQEAIEEANRDINLTEQEITEILEIIVKAAV